jgi:hypothetical protein
MRAVPGVARFAYRDKKSGVFVRFSCAASFTDSNLQKHNMTYEEFLDEITTILKVI